MKEKYNILRWETHLPKRPNTEAIKKKTDLNKNEKLQTANRSEKGWQLFKQTRCQYPFEETVLLKKKKKNPRKKWAKTWADNPKKKCKWSIIYKKITWFKKAFLPNLFAKFKRPITWNGSIRKCSIHTVAGNINS